MHIGIITYSVVRISLSKLPFYIGTRSFRMNPGYENKQAIPQEFNLARNQLDQIYNQAHNLYKSIPQHTQEMVPLFEQVILLANKIVSHYQNIQQTLTLNNLFEVEDVINRVKWFRDVYKQIVCYRKPGFLTLERESQFCKEADEIIKSIEQLIPILERNTFRGVNYNTARI